MQSDIYNVDKRRCSDFECNHHLEWLVTNGRGGFAMCCVNQMLTRRYHGLLVAAVDPPVERFVLLAKLDVVVGVGGKRYELGTNEFEHGETREGLEYLESFTTRPYPTWHWRVAGALIEQTLCMVQGEDTTFVRYRVLETPQPLTLTAYPVCTSRHFHLLHHREDIKDPVVEENGHTLQLKWQGDHRPAWQLSHNGRFAAQPTWHYGFFLNTEFERGYDDTQDLFVPGPISKVMTSEDDEGLVFVASTQDRMWSEANAAFKDAAALDEVSLDGGHNDDPLVIPLLRATRDFLVVRDGDLKTVIAGYPWFGDWGRDTFISLAGLCLVPGRFDDAKRIIQAFANHVSEGMIPNRFPDFGEKPAYNTVDASLWYIHGIDRYLTYTGDWGFVADRMFGVIAEIIEAHERGTRHGIHLCEDGLLTQGERGLALTWMDAKLPPNRAITPRIGKAVEINALWYNALCIGASYAERLGDHARADRWKRLADACRRRFNERFWNGNAGCLYDVVDPDFEDGGEDAAFRPNQLFAISLTHPVLDESRWASVVALCEKELWTPIGMRTLAPDHPAYRPTYDGDLEFRDTAYHQGTVWPWPLGPFITAYVKAHGATPEARQAARKFLDGLYEHLRHDGIGSVCEVADAEPPHRPAGCPWQAWSVAEPLRVLCEDIYQTHPRR